MKKAAKREKNYKRRIFDSRITTYGLPNRSKIHFIL